MLFGPWECQPINLQNPFQFKVAQSSFQLLDFVGVVISTFTIDARNMVSENCSIIGEHSGTEWPAKNTLKVIPHHCIAHPYCAQFLHHSPHLTYPLRAVAHKAASCIICVRKWPCTHRQQRNFPQAKLDSEINVRFLLNDHGDLHFFYCFIIM